MIYFIFVGIVIEKKKTNNFIVLISCGTIQIHLLSYLPSFQQKHQIIIEIYYFNNFVLHLKHLLNNELK
jgi:accessory gene regulator protein AgrB